MIATYQQSKQNSGKKTSNKTLPGLLWGELPEEEKEGDNYKLCIYGHCHTPVQSFLACELLR